MFEMPILNPLPSPLFVCPVSIIFDLMILLLRNFTIVRLPITTQRLTIAANSSKGAIFTSVPKTK